MCSKDAVNQTRFHLALLQYKPESRKCNNCKHEADSPDPIIEFDVLFWGDPPRFAKKDSRFLTDGWECGACMKIFNSKWRNTFVTVAKWQVDMGSGADGAKSTKHMSIAASSSGRRKGTIARGSTGAGLALPS